MSDVFRAAPASPLLLLESWAILHENLQFVPPFTEEARDFAYRRNFKPSGIIIHGAQSVFRRRAQSPIPPQPGMT